jgi:tRNA pseudouridine38-40 synthase
MSAGDDLKETGDPRETGETREPEELKESKDAKDLRDPRNPIYRDQIEKDARLAGPGAPRTLLLTVAYYGRGLAGWQRQDNGLSVQELLEKAVSRVCGHKVTITGSGRTDAGVHAAGQTATFVTPSPRKPREILSGSNSLLPARVAVLDASEAPPGFSARFNATGKTYTYDFFTGPVRNPLHVWRAWHTGPNPDWELAAAVLPELEGEHDFAAFRSAGSPVESTVRRIFRARLTRPSAAIVRLELTGSGFLRHMARAVAGTVCRAAYGKLDREGLKALIAGRERAPAGHAAPAEGLCLRRVFYEPMENPIGGPIRLPGAGGKTIGARESSKNYTACSGKPYCPYAHGVTEDEDLSDWL